MLAGGTKGYRNGPASTAQFNSPNGLVVASDGTLYVTDAGNFCIRKISPDRVVTTLAGDSTSGDRNGVGAKAQFQKLAGITSDRLGNLYVTDANRIRKVSPDGYVTTVTGSDAGYADGPKDSARFNGPKGIVADGEGNLYVCDTNNHRIRKVHTDGRVSTLVGDMFRGHADGVGPGTKFDGLEGLAIDKQGNLFAADRGNGMVRKITLQGVVTKVAGRFEPGYVNGSSYMAQFNGMSGIAVAPGGTLVVGERGNHRLRQIALDGDVSLFAGTGSTGPGKGLLIGAYFASPDGLAVGNDGSVYVADSENHLISGITARW